MMWLIISVSLIVLFYLYISKIYKYWPERGVKQLKPFPLLGNFPGTFFNNESMAEMLTKAYRSAPNERYVGIYQLLLPTLLIKDPELLKQITVKDFDHFVDHRTFIPEDSDPLWANNLFALTGQRWRDMRSTLSPAFTSSKIKFMFNLISDCAEQFVHHFLKQDDECIEVEMKDIITRLANDCIASAAFGVKCDSMGEPNNEFYIVGKEATNFGGFWTSMKLFGYLIMPKLYKIVKIRFFSKKVNDFFTNLVEQTIKLREEKNIIRPDMIHLLLQARKDELKYEEIETDAGFATVKESEVGQNFSNKRKIEITNQDIASHALIFFFAGFETVSITMCFIAYELAINPDIQEKLIKEIDEVLVKCNRKVTYEILLKMQYFDMIISETLRKWPTPIAIDRICTKPYTIEPVSVNEKPIYLKKNASVWIPTCALHHDPQYFPDPERFDPERFNEKNKQNIKPYTYIPFGTGPRNCIGSRFALLEMKVLYFHLLSHFKIVPTSKTDIPLKFVKTEFNWYPINGFRLGLQKRSTN